MIILDCIFSLQMLMKLLTMQGNVYPTMCSDLNQWHSF